MINSIRYEGHRPFSFEGAEVHREASAVQHLFLKFDVAKLEWERGESKKTTSTTKNIKTLFINGLKK